MPLEAPFAPAEQERPCVAPPEPPPIGPPPERDPGREREDEPVPVP